MLGGLYAQYALGMALMFGVMRIVNTTHGDLVILLALLGISMANFAGLGPFVLLAILVHLAAALGNVVQRGILNRVVSDNPLPSLITTFGLSIALRYFPGGSHAPAGKEFCAARAQEGEAQNNIMKARGMGHPDLGRWLSRIPSDGRLGRQDPMRSRAARRQRA